MNVSLPQQTVPLRTSEEGVVYVTGTRVPLDTVVYAFRDGATPEEIVSSFTSLDLADVYSVIAYVLQHEDEINQYLRQREERGAEIRAETEKRFPNKGLREKLLARRKAMES